MGPPFQHLGEGTGRGDYSPLLLSTAELASLIAAPHCWSPWASWGNILEGEGGGTCLPTAAVAASVVAVVTLNSNCQIKSETL